MLLKPSIPPCVNTFHKGENMKNLVITLIAVVSFGSVSAEACSVLPVNEIAQTNDLAAQAMTELGIYHCRRSKSIC